MEEKVSSERLHLNEDNPGAQLRLKMLGCKEKQGRKTPRGRRANGQGKLGEDK